jgi:hypothetical protein
MSESGSSRFWRGSQSGGSTDATSCAQLSTYASGRRTTVDNNRRSLCVGRDVISSDLPDAETPCKSQDCEIVNSGGHVASVVL